jgi:hypothetical protein
VQKQDRYPLPRLLEIDVGALGFDVRHDVRSLGLRLFLVARGSTFAIAMP